MHSVTREEYLEGRLSDVDLKLKHGSNTKVRMFTSARLPNVSDLDSNSICEIAFGIMIMV